MEDAYPEGSVLLNLGGGRIKWPGWLSVDSNPKFADIVSDIRALPFPDNHVDAMAAVHVVEHINRWEVEDMLKEWLRVMKPGGKLILELPSMEKVFGYISNCINNRQPLAAWMTFFPLWGDPRHKDPLMCHKWGYSFAALRQILIMTGFIGVVSEEPRYHFPQRDMRIIAIKPLTT